MSEMHNGSGVGKCYQEKQRTGIENVGATLFSRVVRGGLSECHLSTEMREERRETHRDPEKSIPHDSNSTCKGPEAEPRLVNWRCSQNPMWLRQRGGGEHWRRTGLRCVELREVK